MTSVYRPVYVVVKCGFCDRTQQSGLVMIHCWVLDAIVGFEQLLLFFLGIVGFCTYNNTSFLFVCFLVAFLNPLGG